MQKIRAVLLLSVLVNGIHAADNKKLDYTSLIPKDGSQQELLADLFRESHSPTTVHSGGNGYVPPIVLASMGARMVVMPKIVSSKEAGAKSRMSRISREDRSKSWVS